jgi:hypothetical protein
MTQKRSSSAAQQHPNNEELNLGPAGICPKSPNSPELFLLIEELQVIRHVFGNPPPAGWDGCIIACMPRVRRCMCHGDVVGGV